MKAKIIRVDFSPRGKALRKMAAERKEENMEKRIEIRIRKAIEASA